MPIREIQLYSARRALIILPSLIIITSLVYFGLVCLSYKYGIVHKIKSNLYGYIAYSEMLENPVTAKLLPIQKRAPTEQSSSTSTTQVNVRTVINGKEVTTGSTTVQSGTQIDTSDWFSDFEEQAEQNRSEFESDAQNAQEEFAKKAAESQAKFEEQKLKSQQEFEEMKKEMQEKFDSFSF